MPGCCVDRACSGNNCMRLPPGTTCGDCAHIRRCEALFGHEEIDTVCDFFPRRFKPHDAPAPGTRGEE
jgi:hypothetical protein